MSRRPDVCDGGEARRLLAAAARGELPRCTQDKCGRLATRHAKGVPVATVCDACHAEEVRRGWARSADWPDLPHAGALRATLGDVPGPADAGGEAVRDGLRVAERSSLEAGSCCFCVGRRPHRVYDVVGRGITVRFCVDCAGEFALAVGRAKMARPAGRRGDT